ncbi:tail fiber protein [Candidatus Pacearchaeota archaeon]|nr:tail fiber protein [Candidatus Pacearchaeota archaeon]
MAGSGIIVMWSGNLNQIPNGWLLCNGTFGTPDLRERFIRGTPDSVDPGDTGGSDEHTHDFTTLGHTHTIPAGTGLQSGTDLRDVTSIEVDTGTTELEDGRPPYFNLAFLMKA